jgi:hypothetical protein
VGAERQRRIWHQSTNKNRTDGLLCENSDWNAFNADWIGIQDPKVGQLAQIGFEHDFNASDVGHYCRFWATGAGFPHDYDCGSDPDDTMVYFKIVMYQNVQGGNYYDVLDCGTEGDFSNCTLENGTQVAFANPQAVVVSEQNYFCTIEIMGSNSDRVYYGNSSWNVDGEDSSGWAQRSWSFSPSGHCSNDYEGTSVSDGLRTWDSRDGS